MNTDARDTLNDRVARLPADRQVLIEKLLNSRAAAGSTSIAAISPRDRSKPAPLSYGQQRLWFLHQLGGDEPFYNADFARRFSSAMNFGVLEQAINELVRRHESLRTTFETVEGEPVQVIAPQLHIPLVRIDLSGLPLMRRESEAARLALEEARQPFDLGRGPLLRTKLVKLADDDYMLLLTMHHIVCDGWSMRVLAKDLTDLYRDLLQGHGSLPQLPIQYADYAVWQRNWLENGVLDTQLAYWKKRLAGLSTLRLPSDRPRPPIQTYRGRSWYLRFPPDLMDSVRSFSQRVGVTPFMTLLTAYLILLHRYSGQDDIVVGVPVANRNRPETQGLIGFFVNTLVMRTDLSGNPTVRELLDRVQLTVSAAFAYQDAPFERLVEELQPQRDLSRNPIFQVSLQFYQDAARGFADQKAMHDRVHVDKGTAGIDLAFDLFEAPDGLMGRIEYSTDLFEKSTIERMVGHFQTLLSGMPTNLDTPVADLAMLTSAERTQLLVTWNQTRAAYPRDACIHQFFEAQAARTPEAIAVISPEGDLTYRELDQKSSQLAFHLQLQGVKPDVLVAICMERSLDMIVGLLGILKAGGAYLPLDPAYPQERVSWILEDSQAPILVSQPSVLDRLATTQTKPVCLDGEWHRTISPSAMPLRSEVMPRHLAYVTTRRGRPADRTGSWSSIARLACNWPGCSRHFR